MVSRLQNCSQAYTTSNLGHTSHHTNWFQIDWVDLGYQQMDHAVTKPQCFVDYQYTCCMCFWICISSSPWYDGDVWSWFVFSREGCHVVHLSDIVHGHKVDSKCTCVGMQIWFAIVRCTRVKVIYFICLNFSCKAVHISSPCSCTVVR